MKKLRAVSCPSCGATLKLQGGGRVQTIVCRYCRSVIDLRKTDAVLASFKDAEPPVSYFRVGMEGKIDGICWRIIGWIVYRDRYGEKWNEFLLFSQYFGYAWLVDETDGRVYLSRRVRDLDLRVWSREYKPPRSINYRGKTFFVDDDPYGVFIDYVEGELTWIAKRDDKSYSWDYKASDGSYINIDRTQIEVESYYTTILNSSEVEKSLKLPKSRQDMCKDDLDNLLTQNRKEDLDKENENEDENEKVPKISHMAYLMVLFLFSTIFLLNIPPERELISAENPNKSFVIKEPKSLVDIMIERVDGEGFNPPIEIELSAIDKNRNRKILTVKDGKIDLNIEKNISIEPIKPDTKVIKARLFLEQGKYLMTVGSKSSNAVIYVEIISDRSQKIYLQIFIFLLGAYLIYKINRHRKSLHMLFSATTLFLVLSLGTFLLLMNLNGWGVITIISLAVIAFERWSRVQNSPN
jgi:hypothetical protein